MAYSKIILNNETLMDVTTDTVNASNLLSGNTATAASGQKVTGTLTINDFVITLSQNQTSGDLEPDCTFAEAVAAYNGGKNIVFTFNQAPVIGGYVPDQNCFQYAAIVPDSDGHGADALLPINYTWTSSGVTASEGITFYDLANSQATARPSEVLYGEVFYNTSGYQVGTIQTKTSTNVSVYGATVYVPSGYYVEDVQKTVAITDHANPTASINSSTGLVTASHTQTAGYIPDVSAGTTTGTLQLTTQAAKTVTPSTSSQTAVAAGRYTTGAVTVAAMPSGTAGTPTVTKGTVSNNSVSVTPSVTNSTGYITGGTKNGTAVTVSVSELVSGTKSITENGTGIDVTNYANVNVDVPVGASNVVVGSFEYSSANTHSITLPYNGTGYPIAFSIFVTGGIFDPDTTWYDKVQNNLVGYYVGVKDLVNERPTYPSYPDNNTSANTARVFTIYKNSTSSATTFFSNNYNSNCFTSIYGTSSLSASYSNKILQFTSDTVMRILVGYSPYTFGLNINYTYIITYSE